MGFEDPALQHNGAAQRRDLSLCVQSGFECGEWSVPSPPAGLGCVRLLHRAWLQKG